MQGAGPQAIELCIYVKAPKGYLRSAHFADMQIPKGCFHAEWVELSTLQLCWSVGVLIKLLVDHVQGYARHQQKAYYAVAKQYYEKSD